LLADVACLGWVSVRPRREVIFTNPLRDTQTTREGSVRRQSIGATAQPLNRSGCWLPYVPHSLREVSLFVAALLLGVSATGLPARAAFVVTMQQEGSDVIATGSGTINTGAMTFEGLGEGGNDYVVPEGDDMLIGQPGEFTGQYNTAIDGPTNFGDGSVTDSPTGAGDELIFTGTNGSIYLPLGYISGASLSDTATFSDSTFASLGITPGTYTWTWGSGDTADSFTLDAVAVPEPTTAGLLSMSLLGLLARRRCAVVGIAEKVRN
jgi:hypothetical protein